MKEIKLTQGQVALVDDEDYEYINQWKWQAHYSHSIKGYYAVRNHYIGYFNGKEKGKLIRMSRLIMERMVNRELGQKEVVDHINNNPLDNCRSNLRIASRRQTLQNRKCKTSSEYPRVSWHIRANKWLAQIRLNGKLKYLGYFVNEKDAAKAYERACRELVGEELICKT